MDLSKILQSPIELKIVSFFHRHPSSVDTAQGIATWINRDVKSVERALEGLVSLKIIIVHRTDYATAYAYTNNKSLISKVNKLLKQNEKD